MHRNHISTDQNACINEKYENARQEAKLSLG